jgi:CheY-like chemotaxis protein
MTEVANHGGEALERLRASQFWKGALPDALDINVVLMDKEMPVMDGLVCTSKIRELEKAGELQRHVPIIAVTANARSEQIATLLAAGMVSRPDFLMLRAGIELTNPRTTLCRNPSALAT